MYDLILDHARVEACKFLSIPPERRGELKLLAYESSLCPNYIHIQLEFQDQTVPGPYVQLDITISPNTVKITRL